MKNYGKPWKPPKNHGKPWKTTENYGKPPKNHGIPWKTTKKHEQPQKNMENHQKLVALVCSSWTLAADPSCGYIAC